MSHLHGKQYGIKKEAFTMNELKSNARLSLWLSVAQFILAGIFAYLTYKYFIAKEFINFATSGFAFLIFVYNFLRIVRIYCEELMEISRQEMIQALKDAQERWQIKK